MLRKNKRGSAKDLGLIMVVMLVFGMMTLIGFKLTSEFNDRVATMSVFNADARTASQTLTNQYTGSIDNSFVFLAIGMALVSLILASLVRIHPVFIPLFFIAWVVLIFVSGILSNIYTEMAANANLLAQSSQLTFIPLILGKLPWFVGVFGILLMTVMYKLWSNSQ